MARRVLVIDDEQGVRSALTQLLEYEEIEVKSVGSGVEGIEAFRKFHPHVVFLDVKMSGLDGLETLKRIMAEDSQAVVIMISGHGTIQTALEATQLGAYDFLEKPLDTDRILLTLKNAFERSSLAAENAVYRSEVEDRSRIVGSSTAVARLHATIDKVAPTPSRVLITGPNGSGKELVARAIHAKSPRAAAPFIELNCAAIPSELIESELFGHIKGSFTGAVRDHAGKFEQADGGTLFLDEVGDMSLSAQAKVLRVLQEGDVTRIGGDKAIRVDVRVIAATNKDVETEISEGRFREDLYYRLNVVPIEVPPLSARPDDIPELIEHFASDLATRGGLQPRRFDGGALDALRRRDWPGNIRELRNAVERLMILAEGDVTASDVAALGSGLGSAGIASFMAAQSFEDFKGSAERAFIESKLEENGWNVSETARRLDMPRSNLYKKIDKYGLGREDRPSND